MLIKNRKGQQFSLQFLKITILLIICINCLVTLVQATPQNEFNTPGSGTLRITNEQQQISSALILKTDIKMDISGLTARVKVIQSFRNESDQWVEGKYLFPLPDNAAVDRLTIKIGEHLIVGEIKEKSVAKNIYQQAKISGRKASLVEQYRPNLFTNSVANIGPYETVEIIIEYQQDIIYHRDDGFSIRFPMAITPRYQPQKIIQESFGSSKLSNDLNGVNNKFFDFDQGFVNQVSQIKMLFPIAEKYQQQSQHNLVDINIELNAGFALQALSSSSHKIYNHQKSESSYNVKFVNQKVKADHDFILNWKPVLSVQPRAAIFTEQKSGKNYLSVMIMPPFIGSSNNDDGREIAREIIFVIDTSGSMGGESIRQARKALEFGLSTLSATDKFNVIQFNSTSDQVFANSRDASRDNIQIALSYVRRLKASGGTEMYAAIRASLDGRSDHKNLRQVIFLTDGAISNEAQLFEVIAKRLGDSRLFTVGIGSAPNEFFMKKAARFGRGSFTFIADINQSQAKIENLFDRISQPQLTHINIQWPDGVQSETWPSKIPDLYDGEPLWIKSKVSELAGDVIISGRLNNTLWQSNLSLNNPKQQTGIAVLWAREKIAAIMNSAYHGVVDENQKEQIISTALKHHLVSRFTSLVAVDKVRSRVDSELVSQNLKPLLPKGSSGTQLPRSSLQYSQTGLDLDITARWSFYFLILSLIGLILYRRVG